MTPTGSPGSVVPCPRCGAVPPLGARFCHNCALPLDAGTGSPAPPGPPSGYLGFAGPTGAPGDNRGSTGRRSGRRVAIVVACVLAASVAVAVVLILAFNRASKKVSDQLIARAGRPSGYHGPAYPGMLIQDRVAAGPGATITYNGEDVTASALVSATGLFGTGSVCATVTVDNRSSTTANFGPGDWKLQQADGTVQSPALNSTLQIGQLAPAGHSSGLVCFTEAGSAGQGGSGGRRVLLWQPLFQVARGVWLQPQ